MPWAAAWARAAWSSDALVPLGACSWRVWRGVWRVWGVAWWRVVHGMGGSQSPAPTRRVQARRNASIAPSTAIEASLCPRSSGSRATADACWERGCPSTGFAGEQLVDRALFHDAPGPIAAAQ
jgi:hypothetical protein